MTTELLALPYSPWSERSRWALAVHQAPHRYRHYAPLIGEPALRPKLNKWRGPVTVPILTDGKKVVADSAAIARWADARGSGPRLFPRQHAQAIANFIDLSERGLAAGRANRP